VDGPGYQSRDDGSTTAHPHIRSVDWVWTDTEKWSVTEIGLENQFKQDTVYDYNYFEEFRYKFADSIEGGVGIFEPLETKSRDHTDGSPTHFDTVSKGGGITHSTIDIIDGHSSRDRYRPRGTFGRPLISWSQSQSESERTQCTTASLR
jgi:hypothetical protein